MGSHRSVEETALAVLYPILERADCCSRVEPGLRIRRSVSLFVDCRGVQGEGKRH